MTDADRTGLFLCVNISEFQNFRDNFLFIFA